MSGQLIRKVAQAALKGERGEGGWLKVDAPKASDKDISQAIMEAVELDLVKGCDVSHMQSPYPEWRLVGPTGRTRQYVRETRLSKKIWVALLASGGAIIGLVKWLIPILIKK